jgi:SPP1 family predicted phage head-tail adaptor
MRNVRAGDLRQLITLQHPNPSNGTTGQAVPNWTTYATVWAQVKAEESTEHEVSKKLIPVSTWSILMRYRSDVTAQDCLQWEGLTLNIVGNPMPDERKRWLTFTARSVG